MAGFGNLADPRNNRLAMQLIGSGNYNNGTVYGGLAHALQQGMLGYIAGDEAASQKQAQDVLKQAGQAMTGRYEGVGPMEDGTAGYIDQQAPNGRLAAQLLMSNPYTAPQGMQLAAMMDARDAENQQWNDRFNTQNAAAEKRFGQELDARREDRQADRAFRRDMLNEQIAARRDLAAERAASQSSFYVVPTGQGAMMVDKKTGMAQMVGVDESGNLAPRGNPFRPMADQNGGMTPFPTPGGAAVPSATPSPLLSPSIDPAANAAKTTAVEDAKRAAENKWEASPAYSSLAAAVDPLNRLDAVAGALSESPGLERITGLYSVIPNIPGGAAADAQAQMKTLKSQIAQNVLQMYRNMSQTGGAVGQVSNFEQEMFQNNLAALDQAQSPAQFKKSLSQIQDFVRGSKDRLARAYERQYLTPGTVPSMQGSVQGQAPASSAGQQPSGNDGWGATRIR